MDAALPYSLVRDQIRTGDLIGVRSRRGAFAHLTRWVTGDPHTHTAVAVRVGGRVLCIEQRVSGATARPLSQLVEARVPFDVHACPVPGEAAGEAAWESIGSRIDYDVADLARIAAHRLFGIPLPPADDGRLVCSALSVVIYRRAGWAVPAGLPSIPAPGDVCRALPYLFSVEGDHA